MEYAMKVWGRTSPLFHKNNVEIHRLEGEAGGYSSKHRHTSKYNMFIVEEGSIRVSIWRDGMPSPDTGLLRAGETITVSPGVWHRFEVVEDCVAYEVYWVDLDPGDIEREDHGGKAE